MSRFQKEGVCQDSVGEIRLSYFTVRSWLVDRVVSCCELNTSMGRLERSGVAKVI